MKTFLVKDSTGVEHKIKASMFVIAGAMLTFKLESGEEIAVFQHPIYVIEESAQG